MDWHYDHLELGTSKSTSGLSGMVKTISELLVAMFEENISNQQLYTKDARQHDQEC